MSEEDKRSFTEDFGLAARDADLDFELSEPNKPVPWPFIAIAVALAVWGGATLYYDSEATDSRGAVG